MATILGNSKMNQRWTKKIGKQVVADNYNDILPIAFGKMTARVQCKCSMFPFSLLFFLLTSLLAFLYTGHY